MKDTTTLKNTRTCEQPDPTTGNDIPPFHSTPVSDKDVARLKEVHSKLNKLAKITFKLAREAGEILCRIKEKTPHGKWEQYVVEELGIPPRTASNYMRIWRETSHLKGALEFVNSENISDLGIRNVLDYLAEQKKSSPPQSDDNSPAPKSGPISTSQATASLSLVDGSKIPLSKIGWKAGLITASSLEEAFSEMVSQTKSHDGEKGIAREQRFIVEIAACINRRTGTANPDTASNIAQSALQKVIDLISKSGTSSQQK